MVAIVIIVFVGGRLSTGLRNTRPSEYDVLLLINASPNERYIRQHMRR